MKLTKQELQNSILHFAKMFNKDKNYSALLESNSSIYKVVEQIILDMFYHKMNIHKLDDIDKLHYVNIQYYYGIMIEVGYFNFSL